MTIDEQIKLLSRRCERILSEDDLRKKLDRSAKTAKPLRIKMGMDPTAPDVTLGHAVPMKVIRQFQEWGHKAVIIIGDYTARVAIPPAEIKREKCSPAKKSTPTRKRMSPRSAKFSFRIRSTWKSAT